MKIKRFNENNEPLELEETRTNDIIDDLETFMSFVNKKKTSTEALINELSKYQNPSKKGNDQIDDTINALQIVLNNVDDVIDKLDTSIENLKHYNEEGRKYLYTENK